MWRAKYLNTRNYCVWMLRNVWNETNTTNGCLQVTWSRQCWLMRSVTTWASRHSMRCLWSRIRLFDTASSPRSSSACWPGYISCIHWRHRSCIPTTCMTCSLGSSLVTLTVFSLQKLKLCSNDISIWYCLG